MLHRETGEEAGCERRAANNQDRCEPSSDITQCEEENTPGTSRELLFSIASYIDDTVQGLPIYTWYIQES